MSDELADALLPGSPVGVARLRDAIAQGGEGIVYEAWHPTHGEVLIKEYWPKAVISRARSQRAEPSKASWQSEFRTGVDRFHAVGERLQALADHPSILRVHEVVAERNTAYLIMDKVEGATLEAALDAGGFSDPGQVVELAEQLTAALAHVHAHDLLHRDIAPDNLMVTAGYDWRLVLIDFNAAKDLVLRMTKSQEAVVKPGYSPIEQYDGDTPGPWTDIYAAAAVLYRVITGKPPMEAGRRLYRDQHRPLAELRPTGYAPAFLAAIDHGLQPKPDARPKSMADWRVELGLDAPIPGKPKAPPPPITEAPAPEPPPRAETPPRPEPQGPGPWDSPRPHPEPPKVPPPKPPKLEAQGASQNSAILVIIGVVLVIGLIVWGIAVSGDGEPAEEATTETSAPVAAQPVVLASDGTGDATTLPDAVNLALQRSPAVVHIRPGHYEVSTSIDLSTASVQIIGEGPREQIVITKSGEGALFALKSGSLLRNFTIRTQNGAGNAVWIASKAPGEPESAIDGLTIEHNAPNYAALVVDAGSPSVRSSTILVSASDTNAIWVGNDAAGEYVGNTIDASDSNFPTILVGGTASPSFSRNIIRGRVQTFDNSNPSFSDNTMSGEGNAIQALMQSAGVYSNNRISGGTNKFPTVVIKDDSTAQVIGNSITGYIESVGGTNGKISDNIISTSLDKYCVFLGDTSSSEVSNNEVRQCGKAGAGKILVLSPNAKLETNRGVSAADIHRE